MSKLNKMFHDILKSNSRVLLLHCNHCILDMFGAKYACFSGILLMIIALFSNISVGGENRLIEYIKLLKLRNRVMFV